jgi:hypothetical protein
MNGMEKENEIKLHLLESLAMSQRAVSVMIGHYAELSGQSMRLSQDTLRQLELITRYQGILTEKISGVRLRKVCKGSHTKPWLNRVVAPGFRPSIGAAARHVPGRRQSRTGE